MNRLFFIVILSLSFFYLAISRVFAGEESTAKIVGGAYLGLPSVVNLSAGYATNQFGLNISGLYFGKAETNFAFGNGIQLDLYKPIGKFRSIEHRISIISGYTNIKNSTGRRLVYLEIGYTIQWKIFYVQGGIGKQILTSNYHEIQDIFPFLNTGLAFCLRNL